MSVIFTEEDIFEIASHQVHVIGETLAPLVPEGNYIGTIRPFNPKRLISSGTRSDGNLWFKLNIGFDVNYIDPKTGEEREGIVNWGNFIDMVQAQNGRFYISFAPGHNRKLSQLREAVGQNTLATWELNSIIGQACNIVVIHRSYTDNDGTTHTTSEVQRTSAQTL